MHANCLPSRQFENDPGVPALTVGPINKYLDIFWKGMSLVETTDSTVQDQPGVVPNSPPNCAAFTFDDTATILQGTPEMTAVYDDSTVSNFTLGSFYYGCVLASEETEAGDPMDCTLTLSGFNAGGKLVAKQDFKFVADGLEQQMIEASPVGFVQVQFITFVIGAPNATLAGLIDSVNYTIFSK